MLVFPRAGVIGPVVECMGVVSDADLAGDGSSKREVGEISVMSCRVRVSLDLSDRVQYLLRRVLIYDKCIDNRS